MVDNGEVTLLNKSSLYYRDISECLSCGYRYQPSVDFVETIDTFVLLTIEVKTSDSFVLPVINTAGISQWPLSGSRDNRLEHKGTYYDYAVIRNYYMIKMPWWVEDHKGKLFIYYIKKFDTWLYSYQGVIDKAHHQVLHY